MGDKYKIVVREETVYMNAEIIGDTPTHITLLLPNRRELTRHKDMIMKMDKNKVYESDVDD